MPTYIIHGKHRGNKPQKLTITAPNEKKARQAAADILYGRENVTSVKQK